MYYSELKFDRIAAILVQELLLPNFVYRKSFNVCKNCRNDISHDNSSTKLSYRSQCQQYMYIDKVALISNL